MGRQAGQKQAPGQENKGHINDRYTYKTCCQRVHTVSVKEIYCRCAESLLLVSSIPEINYKQNSSQVAKTSKSKPGDRGALYYYMQGLIICDSRI